MTELDKWIKYTAYRYAHKHSWYMKTKGYTAEDLIQDFYEKLLISQKEISAQDKFNNIDETHYTNLLKCFISRLFVKDVAKCSNQLRFNRQYTNLVLFLGDKYPDNPEELAKKNEEDEENAPINVFAQYFDKELTEETAEEYLAFVLLIQRFLNSSDANAKAILRQTKKHGIEKEIILQASQDEMVLEAIELFNASELKLGVYGKKIIMSNSIFLEVIKLIKQGHSELEMIEYFLKRKNYYTTEGTKKHGKKRDNINSLVVKAYRSPELKDHVRGEKKKKPHDKVYELIADLIKQGFDNKTIRRKCFQSHPEEAREINIFAKIYGERKKLNIFERDLKPKENSHAK